MPVRRSLKWDDVLEANRPNKRKKKRSLSIFQLLDPAEITRKKSIQDYSPTTGTCRMSPYASPTGSKEQVLKHELSNGNRKKQNHLCLTKTEESTTEDDEFMVLLSKVEKSSEEITEIMQSLSIIQAFEDSRELGNLIGVSCASCFLKREMQKMKKLMTKVKKQKLFEKKSSGLHSKEQTFARFLRSASDVMSSAKLSPAHPESRHLDSYEFLKAISN